MKTLSLEECQASLAARKRSAYKGDFGHVLIIGGEYGMGGAGRLAGEAALRSGAGLVSLATRSENALAALSACPELMCHGIEQPADLDALLLKATVVAIGPGLGQSPWAKKLLASVLETHLPLVVDADALNLLALNPIKRDNWILTPHMGEAARLLKVSVADIAVDRVTSIHKLQAKYQGVIVLKGVGTLIAGGANTVDFPKICEAGNPGMATAGMGDILTGVIAALVAQKLSLMQAASLGVMAHATAGDKAAKQGERGIMARDLFAGIRECLNP